MAAVRQCGEALQFASEALRSDQAIVGAAVRQNGVALGFAGAGARADRDVVLAAVAQDGFALWAASATLRADREVCRGYSPCVAAAGLTRLRGGATRWSWLPLRARGWRCATPTSPSAGTGR